MVRLSSGRRWNDLVTADGAELVVVVASKSLGNLIYSAVLENQQVALAQISGFSLTFRPESLLVGWQPIQLSACSNGIFSPLWLVS